MPRVRAASILVVLGLIGACKQADESASDQGVAVEPEAAAVVREPTLVQPSPPAPLEYHPVLRVEGSADASPKIQRLLFDDEQLYVKTAGAVFAFELGAAKPTPRLLEVPDGFSLFAISGDELLFSTVDPVAVHALEKSGGDARMIAEFGDGSDPDLVGDHLVSFQPGALRHVPLAGGTISSLAIDAGPEDTRVGVRGSALLWLPGTRGSAVEVARAPFERAEVAIEAGEGQKLLAAAWAGDDSIAYLVRDADGRVSLRRATGDRTDILLEDCGTDYLADNDANAWWLDVSQKPLPVWRITPDRHHQVEFRDPINYIDLSPNAVAWGVHVDGIWTLYRSGPAPAGHVAPLLQAGEVATALALELAPSKPREIIRLRCKPGFSPCAGGRECCDNQREVCGKDNRCRPLE